MKIKNIWDKRTVSFAVIFLLMVLMELRAEERMPCQVIGHRGVAGLMPENTLEGFEKALEMGVDALEMDVHLTRDGLVVVHHDDTLNPAMTLDLEGRRIKNGLQKLSHMTYEQLSPFDVGCLDRSSLYATKYPLQQAVIGARIPLLRDILKMTDLLKTKLYIELKSDPLNETSDPHLLAEAVVKDLKESQALDRAFLISFDWRGLRHAQNIEPLVNTCYITQEEAREDNVRRHHSIPSPWLAGFHVRDYNGSVPKMIHAAGGKGWNVSYKTLTREDLKEAQALGLKVVVWTPNTKHAMKRMVGYGVDGVTTDRPDLLLEVLKELKFDTM